MIWRWFTCDIFLKTALIWLVNTMHERFKEENCWTPNVAWQIDYILARKKIVSFLFNFSVNCSFNDKPGLVIRGVCQHTHTNTQIWPNASFAMKPRLHCSLSSAKKLLEISTFNVKNRLISPDWIWSHFIHLTFFHVQNLSSGVFFLVAQLAETPKPNITLINLLH